ncbi:MAG: hypothetical protein KJ000_24520 [Pirellulaceae bacterium]|nr:hypothetical protein [Pirellulaceae bacterium]
MWPVSSSGIALVLAVVFAEVAEVRADRIILRNLEVISDRRVAEFNEDGLRLDDGTRISWERVERAQVSPDQQAAFDRMQDEIGNQLYRLHQRLAVGDYRGLLEHAEALYPRYAGRDSETAYLVFQSLMWGRLAAGQREAAVEPYVRAFDYLQRRTPSDIRLPGGRRLTFDRPTGMTAELVPLWFDAEACRAALPGVLRAIGEMAEPRPEGMRIYYGTLALSAGEWAEARRALTGVLGQQPRLAELLTIAVAQGEVLGGTPGAGLARLEETLDKLTPENRPLALYWLGRSKLDSPDPKRRQDGMLQLLELPAWYGETYPDVAAAGLYHTMSALAQDQNDAAQAKLRRELLNQYKQTYHADQVRKSLDRKSDP